MKRFLKWIIGIITIITTVFLFFDDLSVARYNNGNINPAVYKAFKSIERKCMAKELKLSEEGLDPSLHLSRRERWVLIEMQRGSPEAPIWASDYYEGLYGMEWELPPFYKKGHVYKNPLWKFWEKRFDPNRPPLLP